LSQGAVEEQVLKRLTVTGTHVTENVLRIQPRKMSLASADRQRVEQDLVEGFPLLRRGRRTPYPTPQIPWGISKTGNGASVPVQSTVNPVAIVDEPAGAGGGEIRERGTCSKKAWMSERGRGRGRGRGKSRFEKATDELGDKRVGGR